MDPITLATVTSALTVLATEATKATASEAGKELWAKVKSLFCWKTEPARSDLAPSIAIRLNNDSDIAARVVALLRESNLNDGTTLAVGTLVTNLSADKVIVANRIDGTIQM